MAGSMRVYLPQASQFGPGMPLHGQFWQTFWPSVTANVGFWAVSEATSRHKGGLLDPHHVDLVLTELLGGQQR